MTTGSTHNTTVRTIVNQTLRRSRVFRAVPTTHTLILIIVKSKHMASIVIFSVMNVYLSELLAVLTYEGEGARLELVQAVALHSEGDEEIHAQTPPYKQVIHHRPV